MLNAFSCCCDTNIFKDQDLEDRKEVIIVRVLARISKTPVQNSNCKISARPDLAINLLQILIPATINSLVCQKGQFTLQLCPRRWFVTKYLVITPQKSKLKNLHRNVCLSKQFFLGNCLFRRLTGRFLVIVTNFRFLPNLGILTSSSDVSFLSVLSIDGHPFWNNGTTEFMIKNKSVGPPPPPIFPMLQWKGSLWYLYPFQAWIS